MLFRTPPTSSGTNVTSHPTAEEELLRHRGQPANGDPRAASTCLCRHLCRNPCAEAAHRSPTLATVEKKLKGYEAEPGVVAMLAQTRGGQWPKDDLGLKISPLLEAMRSINMLRVLVKLHWLWLGLMSGEAV